MNDVTADVTAQPGVEVVQITARHLPAYPRVGDKLFYRDGDDSRIFTVTASGRQENGEWIVTAERTAMVYHVTCPEPEYDWAYVLEDRDG